MKKAKSILISLDTLFATLTIVIAITILFTSHIFLTDLSNYKEKVNKMLIGLSKSNKEIIKCDKGEYNCECSQQTPPNCDYVVIDRIVNNSGQMKLIHCFYCIK